MTIIYFANLWYPQFWNGFHSTECWICFIEVWNIALFILISNFVYLKVYQFTIYLFFQFEYGCFSPFTIEESHFKFFHFSCVTVLANKFSVYIRSSQKKLGFNCSLSSILFLFGPCYWNWIRLWCLNHRIDHYLASNLKYLNLFLDGSFSYFYQASILKPVSKSILQLKYSN